LCYIVGNFVAAADCYNAEKAIRPREWAFVCGFFVNAKQEDDNLYVYLAVYI
jgi:hypothetical protein